MLPNVFVLADVPSPTNEKLVSGAGEPVKENDVGPSGVACFTTVRESGKITASADSDRSWLPPEPSRPMSRMWYGDPEIATAELFGPQSRRVETCPPHARTGFGLAAVKVTAMRALLSPAKPVPSA